jgi:hypothetical protein
MCIDRYVCTFKEGVHSNAPAWKGTIKRSNERVLQKIIGGRGRRRDIENGERGGGT